MAVVDATRRMGVAAEWTMEAQVLVQEFDALSADMQRIADEAKKKGAAMQAALRKVQRVLNTTAA